MDGWDEKGVCGGALKKRKKKRERERDRDVGEEDKKGFQVQIGSSLNV